MSSGLQMKQVTSGHSPRDQVFYFSDIDETSHKYASTWYEFIEQNMESTKCEEPLKLNQFGDYERVDRMTVQDWERRWDLKQTKFHVPKPHSMLQKHFDTLTQGKIQMRILLPLCGKSLDLKWLADEGHVVVGNEAVDEGCKLFFEENGIPYTVEPLHGIDGVLYKAADGRALSIYRCDFFEMSAVSNSLDPEETPIIGVSSGSKRKLCGQFDAVWDRGSFVAIPVTERKRYASVLCGLMKEGCQCLVDCFLVDNTVFGGPPFHCSEEDVEKYFGDLCSIEKVDQRDAFGKWQESWGIKSFIEEVYRLQPK